MTTGTILVVCTGNICRSPVAAALLRRDLATAGLDVQSAGTQAMVDHAPAPEAVEFIRREIGISLTDTGLQLTKHAAEDSTLIITMTEEQRSWVARRAPRSVRRTFTLLELSRIVALLPDDLGCDSIRDFARACGRLRTRGRSDDAPNDIPDPYGGPPDGYEVSFRQVLAATRRVTAAISGHVNPTPEGERT